jgi:hypothetical protein
MILPIRVGFPTQEDTTQLRQYQIPEINGFLGNGRTKEKGVLPSGSARICGVPCPKHLRAQAGICG